MTSVQSTTEVRITRETYLKSVTTASRTSLLPAPNFGGMPEEEALTAFYAQQVKKNQGDARVAEGDVKAKKKASAESLKKLQEAIAKQREAEKKAKGFWAKLKSVASGLAKIAALVASVAATIGTGGAGAPFILAVAALALSGGGMAVREFKLLGKDSDKIGLGMEIGGAVLSVGGAVSGACSGASNAASAAGSSAGTAANNSAAAAGTVMTAPIGTAARAATSTVSTATVVRVTASLTGAAATGTAAGAGIAVASHERDAAHAAVDQENARFVKTQIERQISTIIEKLKSETEMQRENLKTIAEAIQGCHRTAEIAIAGVRG